MVNPAMRQEQTERHKRCENGESGEIVGEELLDALLRKEDNFGKYT
jgi:hypothetical protein